MWRRQLGRDGFVRAVGMARFAEKALGRDPYDPARLSTRRLKRMLCPRAKCEKCADLCGYGREWMKRKKSAMDGDDGAGK